MSAVSSNTEQMGEGWSDLLGLTLTHKAGDTATTSRAVGTYLFGQGIGGAGIRPAPYTTNFGVNNFTYANLPAQAVPHGVGFVWATMLWDMYWALVDEHGFNPDVYDAWNTGGNNLAIQLVLDGMKLQPCSPGFVDGRNAILAADDRPHRRRLTSVSSGAPSRRAASASAPARVRRAAPPTARRLRHPRLVLLPGLDAGDADDLRRFAGGLQPDGRSGLHRASHPGPHRQPGRRRPSATTSIRFRPSPELRC